MVRRRGQCWGKRGQFSTSSRPMKGPRTRSCQGCSGSPRAREFFAWVETAGEQSQFFDTWWRARVVEYGVAAALEAGSTEWAWELLCSWFSNSRIGTNESTHTLRARRWMMNSIESWDDLTSLRKFIQTSLKSQNMDGGTRLRLLKAWSRADPEQGARRFGIAMGWLEVRESLRSSDVVSTNMGEISVPTLVELLPDGHPGL